MFVLHSVLKRGGLIWDQAALPAALFAPRLARVQQAIAAADQDAWLIYGDAQRYGDVAWLTHYLPRVRGALALVPRDGPPTLQVACGSRDIPAAKALTWVDDVRPFTLLPGEVGKLFAERGLERARVGILGVEEQMSVADWEDILALLPDVRWQPMCGALDAARASKDAAELAVMTRAAEMLRDALDAADGELRAGVSERQALAQVDRHLRRAGAEDVRLLIASGPRASGGLRPVDDRVLAAGDTVLLYAAVEHQRYWAEAGRTFVLSIPDAETRMLQDMAARAVDAMRAAASAGASAGAVADAALAVLNVAGVDAARPLQYGLGHAIGLDMEEPPAIRPGETAVLVDGATLALRAVLHGSAGHGASVGQTVVVGPAGARPLV